MILNKKGFTLIELLAAIVLFAIVAGFGTYSITNVIKASKEKNYNLLIKNIKDAAEVYYQECKYGDGESLGVKCTGTDNHLIIQLKSLVEQGYLTGNAKRKNDKKYTLINPNTNEDISNCAIAISYVSGNDDNDKHKIIVESGGGNGCPTNTDYGNN